MSETAEAEHDARARRGVSPKAALLIVYAAALIMAAVDGSIVTVTLPTLGRQFRVPPAGLDVVVTGYLVSVAALTPASGWLGDRLGPRRVLLASIAAFTVASALCGAAGSLGELSLFRILQGASAGLMGPVGLTMVLRTFPPAERARVSGILVVPASLALPLGPVLGGLLVTTLSWRWVFYVSVPAGIAALAFGMAFLGEQERQDAGSFDVRGFALACTGLAALMYGLSEGPSRGWHAPAVIVTAAAGVLLLAALVLVELRRPQPLIDIRLLADRLFRTTNVVMFLTSACYGSTLYVVTLLYQEGLGLSALQAGLSTFPEALGVIAGARVMTRRVYPALGPRRLITSGLVVMAAGMAALSLAGAGTSLWLVRLVLFTLGLSVSAVAAPANTTAFTAVSPARMGRASAFYSAQRQAAGAIGVAVLTTVIAAGGTTIATAGHPSGHLAGYHVAFLTAAGLALLAALAAATIRDEDAAPTIARRR